MFGFKPWCLHVWNIILGLKQGIMCFDVETCSKCESGHSKLAFLSCQIIAALLQTNVHFSGLQPLISTFVLPRGLWSVAWFLGWMPLFILHAVPAVPYMHTESHPCTQCVFHSHSVDTFLKDHFFFFCPTLVLFLLLAMISISSEHYTQ